MQQPSQTLLAFCYNTLVTLSLVLTSLPLLAQSPTTPPTANKDAFTTTWDSTDVVTIPMNPDLDYNYLVNWGDGSAAERITNKQAVRMGEVLTTSHIYNNKGPHTVRITGQFPAIQFGIIKEANDKHREEIDPFDKDMVNKLIAINQWGAINWQSMAGAFAFCKNLEVPATDIPDLSQVTNMAGMFAFTTKANPDVRHWNVANVTNMLGLFARAKSANPDVRHWDVSKVTNMAGIFANAPNANPDVHHWNVSKVTNMKYMFYRAASANPEVSKWDVSKVTNMKYMFNQATSTNPDVSSWNVSQVTNMEDMFNNSGISPKNYTAALVKFAKKSKQENMTLGSEGIPYCKSKKAEKARETLSARGWYIAGDKAVDCTKK